jgi:hypothetical protein
MPWRSRGPACHVVLPSAGMEQNPAIETTYVDNLVAPRYESTDTRYQRDIPFRGLRRVGLTAGIEGYSNPRVAAGLVKLILRPMLQYLSKCVSPRL